jgi:hypothetical protein
MRRSSANAPQRAGVARWKAAISVPVRKAVIRPSSSLGDVDGEQRDQGAHARQYTRPPSSPATDTPFIGERAAARGRFATECGDERAGAKSRHDFVPGSRTGSNGGNVDSLTATRPTETHVPTLATSVRFYRRR